MKYTREMVHCEIEVMEDGSAYRFSVWSDDGRPISSQQLMDALSDAVLMEFGLETLSDPNAELPN